MDTTMLLSHPHLPELTTIDYLAADKHNARLWGSGVFVWFSQLVSLCRTVIRPAAIAIQQQATEEVDVRLCKLQKTMFLCVFFFQNF